MALVGRHERSEARQVIITLSRQHRPTKTSLALVGRHECSEARLAMITLSRQASTYKNQFGTCRSARAQRGPTSHYNFVETTKELSIGICDY